jgi:hypothetical protein
LENIMTPNDARKEGKKHRLINVPSSQSRVSSSW